MSLLCTCIMHGSMLNYNFRSRYKIIKNYILPWNIVGLKLWFITFIFNHLKRSLSSSLKAERANLFPIRFLCLRVLPIILISTCQIPHVNKQHLCTAIWWSKYDRGFSSENWGNIFCSIPKIYVQQHKLLSSTWEVYWHQLGFIATK